MGTNRRPGLSYYEFFEIQIDSTTVRSYQHASGQKKVVPNRKQSDTRSIEEYDREALTKAFLAVLGNAWCEQDAAIQEATRYLGFRRTGPVIQGAFESVIRSAVRKGIVERDGAMLRRKR